MIVVPLLVELCLLFQMLLLILSNAVHTNFSTEVRKHQVLDLNIQSIYVHCLEHVTSKLTVADLAIRSVH